MMGLPGQFHFRREDGFELKGFWPSLKSSKKAKEGHVGACLLYEPPFGVRSAEVGIVCPGFKVKLRAWGLSLQGIILD